MVKYGLNIVFYMKTYSQFQLEGTCSEFEYDGFKFKLTKLNEVNNSYSLDIRPVDDMEHARYILSKVKLALMLIVLENNWVAIEIDENIKIAHMFEEPINLENDSLVSGEYKIDETTLYPIDSNIVYVDSAFAEFKTLSKISKLRNNVDKAFSLNHEDIYADEKLLLALEIYSMHSQFSRKRQFLDLVTILEILKPEYQVSNDSLDVIKLVKTDLKNLRKTFDKNSDEYKEFDRYFHDMHFWETKSINKSLQQFAIGYQVEFKQYNDIDARIKRAYEIRSGIVHKGIIDEEFDEYFGFLKDFVGKLLKVMIY